MPHKKNPITCERVAGLARVVRAYLIPAYENINLWHERDITNSSVERVIFPDSFHITHYITLKLLWVLQNLNVYPKQMLHNIKTSLGVYASQSLMNRLIEKGMNRKDAYKLLQNLSFKAVEAKIELKTLALKNKSIKKYLTRKEIEKVFDLKWFLRNIVKK